ncbi:helix-loop-helix DNA-binding domain containing protein [Niveomyces insectorum RCEF 264]|uniref:Helix-loop-helix DNA-binding domain containing protein n=1 Tax=Niveomyces insectorum RCEF 264 TaxID=1081102 RepID=A0A167XZ44_9HYPO|nr:helix-loop-helix DNA-binding domain containing protein [Niveomyces insectorum RCEF 264]
MNSEMGPAYTKEDLEFDMVKFQQQAVASPSDNVLGTLWGTDNGLSALTYAPGEYLHAKDASYDLFLDGQVGNDFMEWSKNASNLFNQPSTAPMTDAIPTTTTTTTTASTDRYVSPTALACVSPTNWNTDSGEQQSPYTMTDDATTASSSAASSEGSALKQPPTPSSVGVHDTKFRVSKTKAKAASTRARSRVEAKSKSVSSASSIASSASASSSRCSNSGHGGSHNITLRTASRKPKQPIKMEDGAHTAGLSPDSSPSSPDPNAENLTSEERRARQNHNVVEKQYRNRLNAQFERLLAILPANESNASEGSTRHGDFDDRRMSKAEVLELARRRIHSLEQERKQLRAERQNLLENVSIMQRAVQHRQIGTLVGSV